MKKIKFSQLINIHSLKKMLENIYYAVEIPIGIIDAEGNILISAGWQDICTKYHRVHPISCEHCKVSDNYVREHAKDGGFIAYKCLNGMRDIAIPIIIAGEHVATVFFGQFFYEEEMIDQEYFRAQALKYGFDEKEYLDALDRVPRFSEEKVTYILEYYKAFVMTLAESGLRELEYKHSKKELEKSQNYLRTILNSVNEAIFLHDVHGNIIGVNETTEAMFGYSKMELINMNLNDLICKNTLSPKMNLMELIYNVKKCDPLIVEMMGKDKNKNEFWIEANISITMLDEEPTITTTMRNITERKNAELALQDEACELEKLRTEFFANISHELRTPLNIILGAMQVIEKDIQDEEFTNKKKVINNISIERQNCFRLLRLINNLIDSTKLDAGYFELNMINCNIISIVEEITLSTAAYISHHDIHLIFDTDIEEKIVACDPDKIERVMLNLLSNALKFTPEGGSIFVNIFDGEEYITISVEDTGIGIPKEKIDVIFDRFRQVDKSFTRNHEGSGIGLSLVKSLLEMQGADISADSKYGEGTKFIIKFPVKVLNNQSEEEIKNEDKLADKHVEKIKIEFSDIYK